MARNRKQNDNDLDALLANAGSRRQKAEDPETRSRFTLDHNRWDLRDFNKLLKQLPEFTASRQKLVDNIAGEVGYDIAGDTYWALWKVQPEILDDKEIRPSRMINKRVMQEASDLTSYKELRRWTQGDDIGAALAFEKMEPDLEILYDRVKEQQKQEEELKKKMQDLAQAQADQRTAEEIFNEWSEENEEGENDEQRQQMEAAQAEAQQRVDDAAAAAKAAAEELNDGLNGAQSDIRELMDRAMSAANQDFEDMATMSEMWGTEPGELHRLDRKKRLELAKKLNSEKFRRVAQLFGPMKRLAFAEQKRKVTHSPEEIYDLELGDNPARLLPSELLKLNEPDLEILFYKDFAEKALVQYAMRGHEKIAQGGIIYCHDGSGSMQGDREVWAKAVGLCLLHIARKQKRSFYGIQFGSSNQIRIDDFRDTKNITPDKVIDFAEYFFGGGTDFESPLKAAVKILNQEHEEFKAVRHDIVFLTDGYGPISDAFMKTFKDLQKKLEMKVWGISVAGGGRDETQAEPLRTLCDGKIATIKGLSTGEDVTKVFGGM